MNHSLASGLSLLYIYTANKQFRFYLRVCEIRHKDQHRYRTRISCKLIQPSNAHRYKKYTEVTSENMSIMINLEGN